MQVVFLILQLSGPKTIGEGWGGGHRESIPFCKVIYLTEPWP
jgi:hypothetical protein